MGETRYLVPSQRDWAIWDDVNGVLSFMTDAEVIENARENERELGDEFTKSPLPDDPTPEEAWAYVNELWEGDPGGRGWQVRVPAGATWLSLRNDEDDPVLGGGPRPAGAPRQGGLSRPTRPDWRGRPLGICRGPTRSRCPKRCAGRTAPRAVRSPRH
jgi:hypothetical protein